MAPMTLLAAAVAGALSYEFYFGKGEHHFYAITYLQITLAAIITSTLLLFHCGLPLQPAVILSLAHTTLFLFALTLSTLHYRVFRSPLRRFPGPFLASLATLYLPLRVPNPLFRTLQRLHAEHGHFVRIGSADISITSPAAVQDVLGPRSTCIKSPWYDNTHPYGTMHSIRDVATHAKPRRVWSPAFSDKALREYEVRIQPIRNKLLANLDAFAGQQLNVEHWMMLFSYDVVGDVTFGRSFEMLERKEKHWVVKIMTDGVKGYGNHAPTWLTRMAVGVPGVMNGFLRTWRFCEETVMWRWQNRPERQDIMSTLMLPYDGQQELSDSTMHMLSGDTILLIVAGSDTQSITLTCALMLLAHHPEHATKLRAELTSALPLAFNPSHDEISHTTVQFLPHLNGVLNETMRLYPAIPTHPTRITPPSGAMIAGEFIPGGTTIYVPAFVIGRSEEVYARAKSFIPERWYNCPEMVKHSSAFAPFGLGPWGCIGRTLGLMNMRVTLARMVLRYEIEFAPGSDRRSFDEGLTEAFSLGADGLMLRLKRRSSG